MNTVLIENRGKQLAFVNQVLGEMQIPATKENNNQNVAVIKDVDNDKVVAVIGFNSDSGTDYYNGITVEHEILYLEKFSIVTAKKKYLVQIKEHVALWLLNYLTRQAVLSSRPVGCHQKSINAFDVAVNVPYDKGNILSDSYAMISDTFNVVKKSLGFS